MVRASRCSPKRAELSGLPTPLTQYTDQKHYRIPQPDNAYAFYGMMRLGEETMAFTSCRRFIGKFYVRPGAVEVVVDTENLSLAPGESWELEEFFHRKEGNALVMLGDRIVKNHPPLKFAQPPTGWCSWYCFGPKVTSQQVLENLDFIAKEIPSLKYIQIDDGYQPAMGDWLETGKAFGGDVQGVLKAIRAKGFEPAIWVARSSRSANRICTNNTRTGSLKTIGKSAGIEPGDIGGWRYGPWSLWMGQSACSSIWKTCSAPCARNGLLLFQARRKLLGRDAWRTLHDAKATRIEAYRRGMAAVLKGAGDAFILGCNHPIWPSFGLIHGSRSSGDISRRWQTIAGVARENLLRNWQNGKLWWNDPDCVLLTGNLPENEFYFHAAAIYATAAWCYPATI